MRKSVEISWKTGRQLVASLDGTEESTSYGTPAMKVGGKLFARLHQDGGNIVLRVPRGDQARLMRENPEAFHITPHYAGTPYVLARMAVVSEHDLAAVLEAGWREVAG